MTLNRLACDVPTAHDQAGSRPDGGELSDEEYNGRFKRYFRIELT
jgi:hypothetical protein